MKRLLMMRSVKALLAVIGIALLCYVTAGIALRARASRIYSEGNNGLWLRHSWVGVEHSAGEYHDLALMLRRMRVSDAYFHTGPLRGDGTLDPAKHRYAKELIESIHRTNRNVRVCAWLGQVESGGGGPLDISDPKVRENVVKSAGECLDLGFDGIHYDIEPISSGNRPFILLLRETRVLTSARSARLSVAACKPEPFPSMASAIGLVARDSGYWTRSYYLQVAREVDQVTVMSYDSGIMAPTLYAELLDWTVNWSVSEGIDDLIIGIPTYKERSFSHNPSVECLHTAILGLKSGVAQLEKTDRKKVGAAIYAEWTTTPSEMKEYQEEWIGGR